MGCGPQSQRMVLSGQTAFPNRTEGIGELKPASRLRCCYLNGKARVGKIKSWTNSNVVSLM